MTRTISVGYETITDKAQLEAVSAFLTTVQVDGVAVSAGRADWSTFRWAGHEADWCFRDESPDGDPFAEAVAALAPDGVRTVTAVVDVFVGRSAATRARTPDGEPVDGQVSLAELTGDHGAALTEMCDALAAMTTVDSINLTELQYDAGGFGADDLDLFRADTGLADWPRDSDGTILATSPAIGAWRSIVIARFVADVARVVHGRGKQLIVDVRAPGHDHLCRGTEFGLDYARLIDAGADRLGVWHYVGGSSIDLGRPSVLDTLSAISTDRVIVEVGLWGDGDSPMPAESVRGALEQVDRAGFADAWVTPASLLTPESKAVLQELWR